MDIEITRVKMGVDEPADRPRTAYEAFAAVDAIGCFEGPADLSTNPRHREGFGINAGRCNNPG